MLIRYLGPSPWVNVHPYGSHKKNEEKEYPGKFGLELLETSKKQQFEAVDVQKADKKKKDAKDKK